MARLTNEHLHSDIQLVKNDVEHLRDGQTKMQDDITMIKKVLLNPDDGAIARVNRNTDFRKKIWGCNMVSLDCNVRCDC